MDENVLTIWAIFENPDDFPGKFVVRPQHVMRDGGIVHDTRAWVCETLEQARACVPPGLFRMLDDPRLKIVEVWL